ncbi:MAG: glutamine--fructose-6-phosphate transaminase (isomerizing) [Flavobacteriales bacterium TMED288]|mgnify:FL=1|nr:glutamine--fructose-6-phosphate transaminase (isomerizing) [Flavobacteriales bacterium]RPG53096.1 MAG: glutamine--fructose-6-phosphate transaminase (isomerizing) [Flavobacteriales bacterium TMED288]|tara:strand:- start:4416 stop:6260 length:1845 start_codon:yes stop_codon:yes gene_type:complete
MCGIVGYIGSKNIYKYLINGLKRLEYRGYDSSGIAVLKDSKIEIFKKKGKVSELEELITGDINSSKIGIGHTRWATHGIPNDINSHPHYSQSKKLAIIHNGIIENATVIKKGLKKRGFSFTSDTDTEVLINLIEFIKDSEKVSLEKAVKIALNQVIGAYAIVIIDQGNEDQVIVAKKGSPLVFGLGDKEYFIASDPSPFIEFTNKVIYLGDEEVAKISLEKGINITSISNQVKRPKVLELAMELQDIEKGGYDYFMLKEINEQPKSIFDTLRGRLIPKSGIITLGGFIEYEKKFLNAKRIIILGCGTSWHAGLVGEYLIEDFARIPVEVEYASEFRYRNPIITEQDIVIAVSQSGETADTLSAISLAKRKGATIFGICNVVGSSIARESHAGAYTHAGPEIGVASTKAFTAQVTVFILIALILSNKKGIISSADYQSLINELNHLPNKVDNVLKNINSKAKYIASIYKDASNCLFLGRGINFPVALEGALKLKEISYIHAEGYPAAEMKHGPIALIDEDMPTVVIASQTENYEKVVSNIQEVKARNGKVIAIINEGDNEVRNIADHVIEVPLTDERYSPLINTIPLQLLSYHIAVMRGCNVDQPRNLAKSVTVE